MAFFDFDFDDEAPKTKRRQFSKREKELLFADQKGKCMYCGKKMEMSYFDIDHKKPVATGGEESDDQSATPLSPVQHAQGQDDRRGVQARLQADARDKG